MTHRPGIHPLGFIHGRFQVLHNDHLTYLLAGMMRCEKLIIGVTNPDAASIRDEATNPARSAAENNPLTFDERKAMIEAALTEAGVSSNAFEVVPFAISDPDRFEQSTPKDAIYFLTIYDDWGREKKQRFEAHGLTTEVMWERPETEKGISGMDVRAAVRNGSDWRGLVPPSVAAMIEEWNLRERFGG